MPNRRRGLRFAALILALSLAAAMAVRGAGLGESEPNNTPATANPLEANTASVGAIDPAGDVDYYALAGVNTTWGFIALLQTDASSASTRGTLTALGNDGTTVLRADTGSWKGGSGLALQNYADGSATHYLRVREEGDDARLAPYTLRYFRTVVATQSEQEPNDTRANATPSSFSMAGALSASGDVDCFSFHGRSGDTVLLAVDGDPERDGSQVNPVLELQSPTGALLDTADVSGGGGSEFLEYVGLPADGAYTYCLRDQAGGGSATGTYRAGLVRNGGLYFPAYTLGPTWLDPRPGGYALVGDQLTFRLAIANTSPLPIPGNIRLTTTYSSTCLSLQSVQPAATHTEAGYVSWENQKTDLAPGETYSVTLTLRALAPCSDRIYQDTGVLYFFTGHGNEVRYTIHRLTRGNWLPLALRRGS